MTELRRNRCPQIGLVGFCMGSAARIVPTARCAVDATVGYYGIWPHAGRAPDHDPRPHPCRRARGAQLAGAPGALPAWFEGMANVDIHIYEGTQHAFFNDVRADLYDETAATLSWDRDAVVPP